MTREEVNDICIKSLGKFNCTLLELATGFGKTALSIKMVNYLVETKFNNKRTSMLLLVAKNVHKQTWKDEIAKWGGIKVDSLTIECYESLRKHEYESFDIIVMDEMHHIGSDKRLESLSTIKYQNMIGLSATIPRKLKSYFQYKYYADIVSCDVVEAIEDNVLPTPKIILFPLKLDNTRPTETIAVNPRANGMTYKGTFDKLWYCRKTKTKAIISCTQAQKVGDYNSNILRLKNQYVRNRQEFSKNRWLFESGERIKYLANLKNNIVLQILQTIKDFRSITFCKTIEQAECLGKYAIHSKNKNSDLIYSKFNSKEINHITSVNILNENANLIDCKYAIFANYSSSESIIPQRIGRALRHKSPIIIMPFYEHTREEEIVKDMLENFNKNFIVVATTFDELKKLL